jgi:hypothetical protein
MSHLTPCRINARCLIGSAIFATAILLGLFAWKTASAQADPREPAAGEHFTRGDVPAAVDLPSTVHGPPRGDIERPEATRPTRATFMATWQPIAGAIGYRLDVSTDSSFTNFVPGYEGLDVGNVTGAAVTGLRSGTTYYYRTQSYDASGASTTSEVATATTASSVGLVIRPVFDGTITNSPNAAAIEAMINRTVAVYESMFSDPITITIRFRYSINQPDGTRMPAGAVALSRFVVYSIPWGTYINALRADGKTSYDNPANGSLPPSALSAYVKPSSAGGRAVRLNTPPAMYANGSVASGGPYDGIVTFNAGQPLKFSRPPSSGYYDAQTGAEHEIDEIIGLGSRLGGPGADLRPQDLFSWATYGQRNLTTAGGRYFSIDRGRTNIVSFNQTAGYDFGDWYSPPCPQPAPRVQNAFGCKAQSADISPFSPEGINLDVIGYDLVGGPVYATDFNADNRPDYVLYNASTRQTIVWYIDAGTRTGQAAAPTLPNGWTLADVADFNRDGHPDYLLFNPSSLQTTIWYLSRTTLVNAAAGPTLPAGWQLAVAADFNRDGKPDYILYNSGTGRTVIWYMNNNVRVGSVAGPTLPAGWRVVGLGDFNSDGKPDYTLFNPATKQTQIWFLSGATVIGKRAGLTLPSGYELSGVTSFNVDKYPDYLLYNPSTRETTVWFFVNTTRTATAFFPTLPAGWSLAAP